MPRRSSKCLTLFVLSAILITSTFIFGSPRIRKNYYLYRYRPFNQNSIKPDADSIKKPPSLSNTVEDSHHAQAKIPISQTLHVSIMETGGSHEEVVATFVHAFGSQPAVQLALYQMLSRYDIADVMNEFDLSHTLPETLSGKNFTEAEVSIRPDIIVATTCELDIISKYTRDFIEKLLRDGMTYLFCVVHHADRWGENAELEEAIGPWLEKGKVEFITLSPHTARFFSEHGVKNWKVVQQKKIDPIIKYLVPVFPVNITDEYAPKAGQFPVAHDEDNLSFAIQGDYDSSRRDYGNIFQRLSQLLKSNEFTNENLVLHLLGHGKPRPVVPDDVKDHVKFDESLSFLDYYTTLSKAFALLPAFASPDYLDRKASSTVPASLIAGVPLVATEQMLQAYGYLHQNIVWPQKSSQSDIDVVAEILKMTAEERRKKKQAVIDRRDEIIKGNVKRIGDWMEEALQSISRV